MWAPRVPAACVWSLHKACRLPYHGLSNGWLLRAKHPNRDLPILQAGGRVVVMDVTCGLCQEAGTFLCFELTPVRWGWSRRTAIQGALCSRPRVKEEPSVPHHHHASLYGMDSKVTAPKHRSSKAARCFGAPERASSTCPQLFKSLHLFLG